MPAVHRNFRRSLESPHYQLLLLFGKPLEKWQYSDHYKIILQGQRAEKPLFTFQENGYADFK